MKMPITVVTKLRCLYSILYV